MNTQEKHANPLAGGYALLREYRRRDAARGSRRDIPAPPASTPKPWPIDFDPPSFPAKPGRWPESLRRAWRLWSEAWGCLAEDMEVESAAALWGLYDALARYGVRFDPRFTEAFAAWRRAAERRLGVSSEDDTDEDGIDR